MKGYAITEKDVIVNQMIGLGLSGNVIPHTWFEWLRHTDGKTKKGKPYAIAAILLSDIVYWYRPISERDEATGKFLGYRKKFKGDKIQRSYEDFSGQYGFSKGQVRDALKFLEEMLIIDLDLRHPVIGNTKLGNVLYIGLNVNAILWMNHPASVGHGTPLWGNFQIPYGEISRYPMGKFPDTNTEITTETTTDNTIYNEILDLWKQLFPKKSQPRSTNQKLANKAKARSKDKVFVESWKTALEKAAKNPTLQSEGWFDLEFFLRNDENFQKILNGKYDFLIQKAQQNGNGRTHSTSLTKEQIKAEIEKAIQVHGRTKWKQVESSVNPLTLKVINDMGNWYNVCSLRDGTEFDVAFHQACNKVLSAK